MKRGAIALILTVLWGTVAIATPRIRIVGTVQDGGLPHVACRCTTCDAGRTSTDVPRLVSSVAVISDGDGAPHVSLLDATPDLARQLDLLEDVRRAPDDRVDRRPLDAIFLTHAHMGHYTGLAGLGFEAVHAQSIPVYASEAMANYLENNGPWSQLVELSNIVLHPVHQPVSLPGGVRVEAFDVPHRDEFTDTVGFLVSGPKSTVAFVPDTDAWGHWDPPIQEFLRQRDVDLALLDGTFYSTAELPGRSVESIGHPLIVDSMSQLQDWVSAERQVWFIHLNHSNPGLDGDSSEAATILERGFRVAREGDEFEL